MTKAKSNKYWAKFVSFFRDCAPGIGYLLLLVFLVAFFSAFVMNNILKKEHRDAVIETARAKSADSAFTVDVYLECRDSKGNIFGETPGKLECIEKTLNRIGNVKGDSYVPTARETLLDLYKELKQE